MFHLLRIAVRRIALLVPLLLAPTAALALLGASVTLVGPDPIFPGQVTILRIQLSNSAGTPVTGVSLPNVAPLSLPGVLPDGLRVAGPSTYTCTDPNGNLTTPGAGAFSAVPGSQSISLAGGVIAPNFGGTDVTCVILVPVT